MLVIVLKIIFLIIPLLIAVAYFTIAERKIMGSIQIRRGPNVIGFLGLLQPLSDGFKLFVKEMLIPNSANEILFLISPMMSLFLSIMGWAVVPFGNGLYFHDFNLAVIYIFVISALNVYSLLFAGWSSNSKYSFLGAIRSVAQMISYELSISFSCVLIIFPCFSYNFSQIVILQKFIWFCLPFFPISLIFYISILAETNRHPFDLPEAESELVSGYNVEYTGISFALFFLGEYGNMLLMSIISSIFFLGGWGLFKVKFIIESLNLGVKICFGVIFFILNRAIFPRFRYDQLMELCWKNFFIFILSYFFLMIGLSYFFNGL